MKSDIRVCAAWEREHERPVYTLGSECPACSNEAVNSAPAPFNPEDPYGEYRRALQRRRGIRPPDDGDRRDGEDGESPDGNESHESHESHERPGNE